MNHQEGFESILGLHVKCESVSEKNYFVLCPKGYGAIKIFI